jgi:hypothetical protein
LKPISIRFEANLLIKSHGLKQLTVSFEVRDDTIFDVPLVGAAFMEELFPGLRADCRAVLFVVLRQNGLF